MTGKSKGRGLQLHIQKYLLAGALTVIPIWITWVVFQFIVKQLSKFGLPWVRAMSRAVESHVPSLAQLILEPWFQTMTAVILTLLLLYLLGWITTRVIGKRLIGLMDALIQRIPFIQTVYGATKKLISALQEKPDGVQRVVLIEFPSRDMKTVGFVTRTMFDSETGQELAAVYVPTTPNPTSGYLEIVPVENIVSTDWTMDEAMTFIISGGAIAPDRLIYNKSAKSEEKE